MSNKGVCTGCGFGNVELDRNHKCRACIPNVSVSWPDAIAATLQDHPMFGHGRACGCGEWQAWTDDGAPNGCWEEHVTEHILAAIVRLTERTV